VLWPAWFSFLFVVLQHWEKQTGLGLWAGWEAWLQAYTLGTLVRTGASWPGPTCPSRYGFPAFASPFCDIVNAWWNAGFKKKLVSGAFYSLVKFSWQSSNLRNPPPKRGDHEPQSSVHDSKSSSEILLHESAIFVYFPKSFAPDTNCSCLNYEKFCLWPRPNTVPMHWDVWAFWS